MYQKMDEQKDRIKVFVTIGAKVLETLKPLIGFKLKSWAYFEIVSLSLCWGLSGHISFGARNTSTDLISYDYISLDYDPSSSNQKAARNGPRVAKEKNEKIWKLFV